MEFNIRDKLQKARVEAFYDKVTNTTQYCFWCSETKKCAVIDTVLEYIPEHGKTSTAQIDRIIEYINENNLDLEWILESHAHADHLSGAASIQFTLKKGVIGISKGIIEVQKSFKEILNMNSLKPDGSQFGHLFEDGEKFKVGNLVVTVINTPGHTPACVSYYIEKDCIFVGDTLFMPDSGTARCDFPLGNAGLLWDSIQKILSLPPETRLFTCHDYQPGGRQPAWETTVGEEKINNAHVKEGTLKDEFVKWRNERDATLSQPRLIIPSLQVNINGGFFPEPEPNGIVYLKIPINGWINSKDGKGAISRK